ncbi:uncharacterized protein LOC119685870 [Teleopsis dalmanni]|uniref:uncharacterized protein LOC119685870 n=1 Tax=Teleopsis dalmanni TaxID=139649 RepID=UPI0018CCCBB5|nr:uncharacterized protein LOC119685870 [Teleopsis dalmanni]
MDILILNDYCLEEIFKYISVEEQISNTSVCIRFKNIIEGLWRRNTKKTTIRCDKFSDTQIDSYFSQIHHNLEEAEFNLLSESNIETLKKFVYPKVTELTCSTSHKKRGESDEVTMMITKSFPNLTKLCLESRITGKYIGSLTNLEDLDLSCCEYLHTSHLSSVFSKSKLKKLTILFYGYSTTLDLNLREMKKCTKLEELTMDDHHLIMFMDILLSFINLRKLSCYTRDYTEYLLSKLADYFTNKIKAVYINNCFWGRNTIVSSLREMVNLEKLYLFDDDLEDSNMENIAQGNRKLREFHFVDCKYETEYGILNFVRCCNTLEVLNLYGTQITNKEFVQRLNGIINGRMNHKPIKVYFGGKTLCKSIFNDIQDFTFVSNYLDWFITPELFLTEFCIDTWIQI